MDMSRIIGVLLVVALLTSVSITPQKRQIQERAPVLSMVAGAQGIAVDAGKAYSVAESNLEAIGATKLMSELDVSGAGQTIAIVDTGVDPLMQGFIRGTEGSNIRAWYDATDEGVATILGKYQEEDGYLDLGEFKLRVQNLKSISRTFLVGVLPEAITNRLPVGRKVYFVAFDPNRKGIVEAVVLDTDSDLDFTDESVLFKFNQSKTAARVELSGEQWVSVLVADIQNNGEKVVFGFDLNGHGTALASIVSGFDPSGWNGVAPACDLIVAKVLNSDGQGDWDHIIEGVQYSLHNGADVILVGAVPQTRINETVWNALQRLASEEGVHIVMPSGNNGPGAGTLTFSADEDSLLVVSGYYPADSAKVLLGIDYNRDCWYPFSSCGPDVRGNRGVHVLAPAIVAVPEVGYHETTRFVLMEGTSVAAAYAAGSIALLRNAGIRCGGRTFRQTTRSLLEGSTKLDGLLPVEQGYGKIDLVRAWSLLESGISDPRLALARKWNGTVLRDDLWVQGTALGAFPLWVDNFAPTYRKVELRSTEAWLTCQSHYLNMSPVSQRDTTVYGKTDISPGFYSGEVIADDVFTPGIDDRIVVSLSVPNRFSVDGKMNCDITLDPAHPIARQFIRIPESAELLVLSLQTCNPGFRFSIYNPDGIVVEQGCTDKPRSLEIGLPKPGLWQICMFSDLRDGQLGESKGKVEAKLEGVFAADMGTTREWQYFLLHSDTKIPATLQFLASEPAAEWRDRRSLILSTSHSSRLLLPEIDESVDSIVIRLGTVTGSALTAYVYNFDETTGRWVEKANAFTTKEGTGEIYVSRPTTGRYLVYIEAYSNKPWAYAEIDALIIRSDGSAQSVPIKDFGPTVWTGSNIIQVAPRLTASSPKTFIIRCVDSPRIIAVLDRDLINTSDLPVVQVTGNERLKTVRAWTGDEKHPADIVLTIGGASYQLHLGRITAQIADAPYATYESPEENGIFLFPIEDVTFPDSQKR